MAEFKRISRWSVLLICRVIRNLMLFSYYLCCQNCLSIIPASNAWSEQGGNTIKQVKANKGSTLTSDDLDALIMVLTNGPKCGTSEASYLIKQTSMSFGEGKKRYEKT